MKKEKKSLEILKLEAKTYFGARVVRVGASIQIWQTNGRDLAMTTLCTDSNDEQIAASLEQWMSSAIEYSVRQGFDRIHSRFYGKKWKLKLHDYTASLEYTGPDADIGGGLYGKRYEFPMTPEAVLELIDFSNVYADGLMFNREFFPALMGWKND